MRRNIDNGKGVKLVLFCYNFENKINWAVWFKIVYKLYIIYV